MTAKHTHLLTRHYIVHTLLVGAMLLTCRVPAGLAASPLPAPDLSSDTEVASAGFYRLSWQTPAAARVELEEADNAAFTAADRRYLGPDDASVISGQPNGTWYYRAREIRGAETGPWSDVVKVTVAHHPLSRAFMFFGLGVVVFVATLLMVVRGAEGARRDER